MQVMFRINLQPGGECVLSGGDVACSFRRMWCAITSAVTEIHFMWQV